MIGDYVGSSILERTLKQVVDAMPMPLAVDKISWPVFQPDKISSRPFLTYQRRDSSYLSGQDNRLTSVNEGDFDIFVWAANENAILEVVDALESGFSSFPLRNGIFNLRAQLAKLNGTEAPSAQVSTYLLNLETALGDFSPKAQMDSLTNANKALAGISDVARKTNNVDWSGVLASLKSYQANLTTSPGRSFLVTGCRDLTAPEVFQLGLSGRVLTIQAFRST